MSQFVVEPEFNSEIGQIVLSARQIARDIVMLYKVLQTYPCFNRSVVVGPDIIPDYPQSEGMKIIQA